MHLRLTDTRLGGEGDREMPEDRLRRRRRVAAELQVRGQAADPLGQFKKPASGKEKSGGETKIKDDCGPSGGAIRRNLDVPTLAKHREQIEILEKVLVQKKDDKNKIYALHALEVACVAKDKEHKKYEFGSLVAFAVTQKSNVVVAAVNFRGNPNDNKTLGPHSRPARANNGRESEKGLHRPRHEKPKDRLDARSRPNERKRRNELQKN